MVGTIFSISFLFALFPTDVHLSCCKDKYRCLFYCAITCSCNYWRIKPPLAACNHSGQNSLHRVDSSRDKIFPRFLGFISILVCPEVQRLSCVHHVPDLSFLSLEIYSCDGFPGFNVCVYLPKCGSRDPSQSPSLRRWGSLDLRREWKCVVYVRDILHGIFLPGYQTWTPAPTLTSESARVFSEGKGKEQGVVYSHEYTSPSKSPPSPSATPRLQVLDLLQGFLSGRRELM